MDIRNCLKCRRIFTYVSTPYCPLCEKEEEALFNTVRDYVKENLTCTMADVVENTGISMKKLNRYIKEGRLEISKGMVGELTCEICDKPITKGKFCDTCVVKMSQELTQKTTKTPSARMHSRHSRT